MGSTPHLLSKATSMAAVDTAVIDDADALEPFLDRWDELAVAAGRPFCAPAWMLGWWHAARSGDARLRVVVVRDGDELIGVGPFFAQVSRLGLAELRLLGAGLSHRLAPLARPGREREVAAAIASALAVTRPTPANVVFEGVDADDPWPQLFAEAWPGSRRPRMRTDLVMAAPVVDLAGGYEQWLARRTRRFRKSVGRRARRLAEAGVSSRIATDAAAVETLLRLHHERWEERGGSSIDGTACAVICHAAERLAAERRLAVVLLETQDGTAIAAELMLTAGETAVLWGGGFACDWARLGPGTQTLLVALDAAAADGATVVDLGGGAQPYKDQLSDRDAPLAWRMICPPGPRHWLLLLQLAPKRAKARLRRAAHRLPPGARDVLRRIARRA